MLVAQPVRGSGRSQRRGHLEDVAASEAWCADRRFLRESCSVSRLFDRAVRSASVRSASYSRRGYRCSSELARSSVGGQLCW